MIITAGNLKPTSSLRKFFEKHPNAYAAGIYDDPPSRDEIQAELARAGLTQIDPEAMNDLTGLSRSLDPGDFRQTLEKIALYKLSDPSPPLTPPADVEAMAPPASTEAELDDLIHVVAEGRAGEIGPLLAKLAAQAPSRSACALVPRGISATCSPPAPTRPALPKASLACGHRYISSPATAWCARPRPGGARQGWNRRWNC